MDQEMIKISALSALSALGIECTGKSNQIRLQLQPVLKNDKVSEAELLEEIREVASKEAEHAEEHKLNTETVSVKSVSANSVDKKIKKVVAEKMDAVYATISEIAVIQMKNEN